MSYKTFMWLHPTNNLVIPDNFLSG